MPTVLLIGTLDTKAEEYKYVRDRILAAGHQTLVMDLGILSDPLFTPDIPSADVARAGGEEIGVLRARGDRGSAVDTMQRGAGVVVARLFSGGRVGGGAGPGGGG